MRVVERFNKENGIWEEFEFKKLIIGDIFRFFDDSNNVWIATGIPFLNEDDIWVIIENKYNVRYKVFDDYIAIPIQKIVKETYSDKVYNIETTDNLYLISNIIVHNCERLQTLPDNYTEGVSNTQRYKCIGNGWTVDVVAHILSYIKD